MPTRKSKARKTRAKRRLNVDEAERDALRCEGIASRYEVGANYLRADRYWRAAALLWDQLNRKDRARQCMANTNVPAKEKKSG